MIILLNKVWLKALWLASVHSFICHESVLYLLFAEREASANIRPWLLNDC